MTHMPKLTHHVLVASFIYLTTVFESMTLFCVVFRGCTRMVCAVTWPLDLVKIAQELHAVAWPSEYPKSCENRAYFQTIFRNRGGCMIVGCVLHSLQTHPKFCENTPYSHMIFGGSGGHVRAHPLLMWAFLPLKIIQEWGVLS